MADDMTREAVEAAHEGWFICGGGEGKCMQAFLSPTASVSITIVGDRWDELHKEICARERGLAATEADVEARDAEVARRVGECLAERESGCAGMDDLTKQAMEWALNQQFQSVAATYARTLAKHIASGGSKCAAGPWIDSKVNPPPKDDEYPEPILGWWSGTGTEVVLWLGGAWHSLTATNEHDPGMWAELRLPEGEK
ncbi:MAG: hypothetical protein IMZ50_16420 [Candidatus Atribacteria bacterium]|nr:hypothetical protein [Candidatus Atribacteria bacterium]